jgi:hypothetical protein
LERRGVFEEVIPYSMLFCVTYHLAPPLPSPISLRQTEPLAHREEILREAVVERGLGTLSPKGCRLLIAVHIKPKRALVILTLYEISVILTDN